MIKIRDIEQSDREEYFNMFKDLFESKATTVGFNMDVAVSNFNSAVLGSKFLRCLIFECSKDKNILGYAFLSYGYSTSVGGKCIFLEDLYVKPFARGKGVGRRFFRWLLEEYKDGFKEIRLEVTKENVGAVRFYKSLGFLDRKYLNMSTEF